MKTTLILLCMALCALLTARAEIQMKFNQEKVNSIKLVSGKWSNESLALFGSETVPGSELNKINWNWSETNGGKRTTYFNGTATNGWVVWTSDGQITKERTIPNAHFVQTTSSGQNQQYYAPLTIAATDLGGGFVANVPQEMGKLDTSGKPTDGYEKRSSEVKVVLRTGGRNIKPNRGSLFKISGRASDEVAKELNYIGIRRSIIDLSNNIPPELIRVPGFDQNFDTSGELWASLPDNVEIDVTLEVKRPLYKFTVSQVKYPLLVECVAPTPTNRWRTTVGVGEEVNLWFSNSPPLSASWTASAGGLTTNFGPSVKFTAPSNEVPNVLVKAVVTPPAPGKAVTMKIPFSVLEPTGIDHADFVEYWLAYTSTTQAGAGVHLRPFVGPMNVSFYRISVIEVGEDASDISGYFDSHAPPSHIGHGADAPIPINYDNSWHPDWDNVRSSGWSGPWSGSDFSGGSYTWNIPAKWKIGSGPEHPMPGWSQIHTLSADGTMTVMKWGHSVSRTINNVYSGQ